MTTGWSLFVILLTIVNILACVWLLRWTSKPRSATEKIGGGADTGHVWDTDLREYNNPLPRWWLWVFYITVAFGLVYLVLYPGLGAMQGIKGWTQAGQYEQERTAAEARAAQYLAPFAAMTIPQLAADGKAMATARNLFQNNCAQCHGSDGGGARGFPNLSDSNWQWGGDPDAIVQTIANGRVAAGMVAWGPVLGEQGTDKVVAYIQKLSGQQHDAALAAEGEQLFITTGCVGCHGMDGKGMTAVGAPNLTDGVWLYGGDAATLKETVTKGRAGQMPAFGERLGAERVRLLAAYALHLSESGT
jgi:cytochrome c oxidase cbb3-type subunit III